ncbi:prolyl oligopeptidase family serine peptidase [Spirulina sp. CS-785/01]|uniref:prolyl oligopeptidase family serine peptidase n=1 Tax=Spirulina sp. CS-785/01 TaxID=3021716 RepID=UPI00232FEBB1|nr:prolyl oligopeptidase family serine peptidase [Spirulina sp. CS-785/01]MDB9313744.1 prolyl oligopeptidase family serine peptidase [Spirulina sp. CS-785/01]
MTHLKKIILAIAVFGFCTIPRLARGETPSPIQVIDRERATQNTVLSPEEVEKIARLQGFVQPVVMSEISPDGTTVIFRKSGLGVDKPPLFLLNIEKGTTVEIDREAFGEFEPRQFYWRDRNTAIAPLSQVTPQGRKQALFRVNRQTGEVTQHPLNLPGILRSVAPNGSRVLVELTPDVAKFPFPEMAVYHLQDNQDPIRFTLPSHSTFLDAAWTPLGDQLAVISFVEPDRPPVNGIGANPASFITRDAQGLIPPSESPFVEKSVLLTFDLTQGGRGRLLEAKRGDGGIFSSITWSPDGKLLMAGLRYPSQPAGRDYPVYYPLVGERTTFRFYNTQLEELYRLESPQVASAMGTTGEFISPGEVLFTAQVGMNSHLYLYDLISQDLQNLSDWPGTYAEVQVSPETSQLLFRYSSFVDPPELYRMDWRTGDTTPLSQFNESLATLSQFYVDPVTFESEEGEQFQGVLLQPPDSEFPPQDVPLVVWQEGGPFATMKNQWLTTVESPFGLLPNFGFALLVMPLYGRHGFGANRFLELYSDRNFGTVDIEAMAELLEDAVELGYTSPDHIGVMGCSYGGYFAHQSIIRYPELYAAANAQCSILDWGLDWLNTHPARTPFAYGSLTPFNGEKEFQQDSPLYQYEQVTTPLLMFKGSEDFLPLEPDQFYVNMIAEQGVPVRFLEFTDAGHGLVDEQGKAIPEYQNYAAQVVIDWFRQYLK